MVETDTKRQLQTENLYDLVIIGAGPAGLSAAIYMARAKYKVLVLEKEEMGGQITITAKVVNYPGIPEISGRDLTDRMRIQGEKFGAKFKMAEATDLKLDQDVKEIHTTAGTFQALGVILAVGANPRTLGFQGEEKFKGRGVAYCATCDGEFFAGKNLFVVGGGFAAVQESIFLTKYARHITMIVATEDFTCARTVSDQLKDFPNISVKFNTELQGVSGETMLEKASFVDNRDGSTWEYDAKKDGEFGIFVFVGYEPDTKWLPKELKLDDHGYIITDENKMTNLDGVFAAGDVCEKNLRQVVTAVADGALAATSCEKTVSVLHDNLQIPDLVGENDNDKEADAKSGTKDAAGEEEIQKSSGEYAEDGLLADSKERDAKSRFFDGETKKKLQETFTKMERPLMIELWSDESELSKEMTNFLMELSELTDQISWRKGSGNKPEFLPAMELLGAENQHTGVIYHGVPGGHEINSFVIGVFNVAGPALPLDNEETERKRMEGIQKKRNIKILVSLTCTMCPDAVMAAQKIAAMCPEVTAEMFDLSYYPALQKKYQVMSVPCIIIDDEQVHFGKKNVSEILDFLQK